MFMLISGREKDFVLPPKWRGEEREDPKCGPLWSHSTVHQVKSSDLLHLAWQADLKQTKRKAKKGNKIHTDTYLISVKVQKKTRLIISFGCVPFLFTVMSSRTFCPTKPAKSLHTQKNRQFFFEAEDNFWIVMVSYLHLQLLLCVYTMLTVFRM